MLALVLTTAVTACYMLYILDKNSLYRRMLVLCRLLFLVHTILACVISKKIIKGESVTIVVYMFYCILVSAINGTLDLYGFIDITLWPLLFISICNLMNSLGKKDVNRIYASIDKSKGIIFACSFIVGLFSIPLILRHLSGQGRAGEVIFPVYFMISLLALLLLAFPNNKKTLIIPIVAILATTKRTAFLSVTIGLILGLIAEIYISGDIKQKWKKVVQFALVITAGYLLLYYMINKFNLDILSRLNNLIEDGGSGRNEIWEKVLNEYNEGTLLNRLFGHGCMAVSKLKLTGRAILAHDDFLEILYDYGIFGLALILIWTIQLIKQFILLVRTKSKLLPSYCYAMIGFIFLATFSYLMIQSYIMLYFSIYFAIVCSLTKINDFN